MQRTDACTRTQLLRSSLVSVVQRRSSHKQQLDKTVLPGVRRAAGGSNFDGVFRALSQRFKPRHKRYVALDRGRSIFCVVWIFDYRNSFRFDKSQALFSRLLYSPLTADIAAGVGILPVGFFADARIASCLLEQDLVEPTLHCELPDAGCSAS